MCSEQVYKHYSQVDNLNSANNKQSKLRPSSLTQAVGLGEAPPSILTGETLVHFPFLSCFLFLFLYLFLFLFLLFIVFLIGL